MHPDLKSEFENGDIGALASRVHADRVVSSALPAAGTKIDPHGTRTKPSRADEGDAHPPGTVEPIRRR